MSNKIRRIFKLMNGVRTFYTIIFGNGVGHIG